MNRDRSHEITSQMPIVAHEDITGVDCCGCIVASVDGGNVGLRCDERGVSVWCKSTAYAQQPLRFAAGVRSGREGKAFDRELTHVRGPTAVCSVTLQHDG